MENVSVVLEVPLSVQSYSVEKILTVLNCKVLFRYL